MHAKINGDPRPKLWDVLAQSSSSIIRMTRVRLPPAYFSICTSTGNFSASAARASGIGAKRPIAREPGDDHARQDAEHDLTHDHRDEVARTGTALGAKYRPIHDRADDSREKDDERVHDALDQRERDHVSVCN